LSKNFRTLSKPTPRRINTPASLSL